MACLDTSTIIDLSGRAGARRKRLAREKLRSLRQGGEDLVTTRFNLAELWVGVARARDEASERSKVETLIAPLAVLEFDEASAEVFGRLHGGLQAQGAPIGDMDTLIASVCLVNGHSIVTRNARHFRRVFGLEIKEY